MKESTQDRAQRPLVSVIIPAYNSAAYLKEAIDSVLAQSLSDYEILVVDDGSTDDTGGILNGYGAKIRVLRQDHRGVAAARNHGIRETQGEIVAFLDADDLWYPQKLEKQVAVFRSRSDVAMVFTGHDVLDERGKRDSKRGRDKRARLLAGNLVRNIFMSSGVATPTVAVRRSVFDAVGPFDEELEMAEDDNLWMRIASRLPVELVDEPLATIRLHRTSMTRDLANLLTSVEAHVRAMQDRYPDVWAELRDLVPAKLALFHFAMGKQYLASRQHDLARRSFGEGLRLRPWALRYRVYHWICYLPEPALGPLWKARTWIRGFSEHG